MHLSKVEVERFRNFVDKQDVDVEEDVTCLVGKNESGKTTLLKALHRLKPANGDSRKFDLTTEYPMWRLSRDRRSEDLDRLSPVVAEFVLDAGDVERLADAFVVAPPPGTVCRAGRRYNNASWVQLVAPLEAIVGSGCSDLLSDESDKTAVCGAVSHAAAVAGAKERAKELKTAEPARSKALGSLARRLSDLAYLLPENELDEDQRDAVWAQVPSFFYFSTYQLLPGECDLTELAERASGDGARLSESDRAVLALLARAGESPDDFLDDDYTSRKAELQAASSELSQEVFKYWTQNTDLAVVFDAPLEVKGEHPNGGEITHRVLKVELRDDRHGGVETNFETRSAGFRWFFSFFAAFSEYQERDDPVIVLLDEPGTSLHGEAQADFVRFIYDELGSSKQVIYTTHSQHMIDPSRYEKHRAIHDRATRSDPDLGVAVTPISLAADRATVLPIEAAIGYSISQHLFLGGGHHLVVEGSSDFIYLQSMSAELGSRARAVLDPRFAILPAGTADNVPPFVALFGRRLDVTALVDGPQTTRYFDRARAAAEANDLDPATTVFSIGQIDGVPKTADVEDLFSVDDYLRLYGWAFSRPVAAADLPATSEPIVKRLTDAYGDYDHVLPAHALQRHQDEFFKSVSDQTLDQFEALVLLLNTALTRD
ncbi:MAG: AAA family ATPase [Actinomycetota bacterium]